MKTKNIMVDVLVLLRTSTHAAIAEKTEMAISETMVMMAELYTLDAYLMLGLVQMYFTFSKNCPQFLGMDMGLVMISSDDFAELMMTIKNGNNVTINNITVIIVRAHTVIFFFEVITFPPLFSYYSKLDQ